VLVEASAGSVADGFFAFEFAFAHAFGVLTGLVVAGFLFCGGEAALFGSADALVGVHAFEEEFGGADGGFGFGFGADLERGEFLEEALDLFELFE